jgi:hypothetical protein
MPSSLTNAALSPVTSSTSFLPPEREDRQQLDKCAYLPGRESQRTGDRLSACAAFGWRGKRCSHRLAAVLNDRDRAVGLVLVNSLR